jgi:meiotically up-regulated gene 157 (Mug157) protein
MKMDRRQFLLTSSAIALSGSWTRAAIRPKEFISRRPVPEARKFTSNPLEAVIDSVKSSIANDELKWLFENCFPNTLDTTVSFDDTGEHPDTFVITGDIDAMWLRDSSAQVWPYLPYMDRDPKLQRLVAGVINQQTKCILIDPYANAFFKDNRQSQWHNDRTEMKPGVHERKWEIDSLCYTIRLAYGYYDYAKDKAPFGNDWLKAAGLIVQTFKEQQRKEGKGPYHFQRIGNGANDTQCCDGYGKPVNPVGLICSSFRPSDDSTDYLFLIPSNYFAVASLRQLAQLLTEIYPGNSLIADASNLANEVEAALNEHAIVEHPHLDKIVAYETDGNGHTNLMDDANIPALLSLPYLNALQVSDPLYQNTRKFALSTYNPWFFKGSVAEGIGGPHVGKDMIWPMGIIMRAMTSTSDEEITQCLKMLVKTHAGTGFMHEAFNKNNPERYTRKWFAWANTLFGELILKLYDERPALLAQQGF